jgi:hypothetical protein
LVAGLVPLAGARPLPAAPALPPPPPGFAADREEASREGPGGRLGGLPPAEREAIRRLSQEQRDELARREGARRGQAPGSRLTPEERRRLRELIREEHERREERERHSGRTGSGRRP